MSDTRKRVQIELSPAAVERMEKIKQRTGARSLADLVRDASRLYEWLLMQQDAGWRIQIRKGDLVRDVDLTLHDSAIVTTEKLS